MKHINIICDTKVGSTSQSYIGQIAGDDLSALGDINVKRFMEAPQRYYLSLCLLQKKHLSNGESCMQDGIHCFEEVSALSQYFCWCCFILFTPSQSQVKKQNPEKEMPTLVLC